MKAAEFALSIAVRNGAELILLYVFYSQIAYAYSSYLSKVENSRSIDAILHSAESQAKQWFDVINGKLANLYSHTQSIELKNDVIITSTSIPDAIIDYAEQHMVDLIVLGPKSKSAVKKVLLGSTTSEVLKYSRCPVLVVKME
jgi:nucleotide-binding universal stress UspA family protein